MNALRVLASPKVWLPLLGVGVALALVFFAYLAAVKSPEENLKNLPLVLVNEDKGGKLAGKDISLGDQVVDKVSGADSPTAGKVKWAMPDSRKRALEDLGRNQYYGAIVISADYSRRLSSLTTPRQFSSPSSMRTRAPI